MSEIELPDPALVVLVGVAGCGKSTFARQYFEDHEVVSSDECRRMVSGDPDDQAATPDAFDLLTFLVAKRLKWRRLTVVDATNVRERERSRLLGLAGKHDVPAVAIVLDLPLEVCLERDAARGRSVGGDVLRRQHRALEADRDGLQPGRGWEAVRVLGDPEEADAVRIVRRQEAPAASTLPEIEAGKPPAVVVDLDGTLSSNAWRLHHLEGDERDWEAFFAEMERDAPVEPIVEMVRWLARDVEVLVVTGRPAGYEPTVRRWLAEHGVVYDELYLRGQGDRRPDTVVKRELYRDHIADRWDVVFAVDDREQVIEMWRGEGLYVLEAVDPEHPPLS